MALWRAVSGIVAESRYRVLVVCAHPVQYMGSLLRRLARQPDVELEVAYCSLRGVEQAHDPEFGAAVKWDVPILDGYAWVQVPNAGSGDDSFFGLNNPELWKLIRDGEFDAVFCFTGYIRASFWIARVRAWLSGVPFIFGTDSSTLNSMDGQSWKRVAKRVFWPLLFRLASQALVASTGSKELMLSLGIPLERISFTPSSVDNDWWLEQCAKVNREQVRASWGVPRDAFVILFCAKLQPWKRPQDLLHAFARMDSQDAFLVFVGEGPLRPEVEKEAAEFGILQRCRFLGFVNQSQLPAVYRASDVLVLPSSFETFGFVVNEASVCACAVVASDRVGAARDLIAPVDPALIYPCECIDALAQILTRLNNDREYCHALGEAARARMTKWSPDDTVAGMVQAIEAANRRRDRGNEVPPRPERV